MRFLLILFIVYLAYQFLKGLLSGKGEPPQQKTNIRRPAANGEDLVEDPHCHTYVPISDACKTNIDGKTIYFCCKKCQEAYINNREKVT